jgi:hypothetical protein
MGATTPDPHPFDRRIVRAGKHRHEERRCACACRLLNLSLTQASRAPAQEAHGAIGLTLESTPRFTLTA